MLDLVSSMAFDCEFVFLGWGSGAVLSMTTMTAG